jgi:hypothetical protein
MSGGIRNTIHNNTYISIKLLYEWWWWWWWWGGVKMGRIEMKNRVDNSKEL